MIVIVVHTIIDRPQNRLLFIFVSSKANEKNKSLCEIFFYCTFGRRMSMPRKQKKVISVPHTDTLLNDQYSHVHKHEMMLLLLLVFRWVLAYCFYRTNYPKNDIYFVRWKKFSVNMRLCVKFSSKEMSNEQRLPAVRIARNTNKKQLRAWEALTASTD